MAQCPPEMLEADLVIERLRHALGEGEAGLKNVPDLLKRTLREESWKDRVVARTGEPVSFTTFKEFVETPPLEGLGADIRIIENLVRDDKEARSLLNVTLYNIQGTDSGTSADRALRKLRNQRPDLHTEVIRGKLSPHRAMVQAGFRRPTATVYVDSPEAAVKGLLRRFTADEIRNALEGVA